MNSQVFHKHPVAEQFAADLKLLSHARSEERARVCARIGEAGSAAVKPLLQRAVYDDSVEVRSEAMWALLQMGARASRAKRFARSNLPLRRVLSRCGA